MLKNGLILLIISLMFINTGTAKDAGLKNNTFKDCGHNSITRTLARLVITDPDQTRSKLNCNSLLTRIAQEKAEEMAEEKKVTHYGSGGTPDARLMSNGYDLYLPKGAVGLNHVEAIQGGFSSPFDVLDNFKNSYHHRIHLFGEGDYYSLQDEIGVGYARKWRSPHVDYWVVYIAKEKDDYVNKLEKTKDIHAVGKPMK